MKRIADGTTARDYSYVVPQTGVKIVGITMARVADLVRQHLDANGFQASIITQAEIENDWCANHSWDCFESKISERPMILQTVINFTKTMFLNLAKGGERVDQAEANRRAEICVGCENNVVPGGCAPCLNSGAAAATVGLLIGDRTTPFESSLMSCAACGCMNKAQIWFPLADLQGGMSQTLRDSLPDNCWKK
jgi:hypothetical protein